RGAPGQRSALGAGSQIQRAPLRLRSASRLPVIAKMIRMSEPWYADGLRFRCTRCGNCCTGPPGVVWVNAEEIEAIAELRGETPQEVKGLYTRQVGTRRSLRERANGDCVFW